MAYLRNGRAVRGVLVASFAALLVGCAWADTVRIGAWNIEDLCQGGCTKDATDLADYIAESGAQVVGLEEITITHATQEGYYRNRVLDDVVRLLWEKDGHTWAYALFRTSCERSPDDKNLGVLFDTERVTPKGYLRLPVPAHEYHQHDHEDGPARHRILCRAPVAIWFQVDEDQTDFVLIPVHLKANEPSQPRPEQIIDHRRVEATRILEALSGLSEIGAGSEEDVYIGGDTNILDHEDADMKVFLDDDFADLNAGDKPTYVWGAEPPPFDRFVVTEESEEVRQDSFVVHSQYRTDHGLTKEQFDDRFSDHYLVSFEIELVADDD